MAYQNALRVVNQVKDIDLDDGVSFEVKDVSNIMDEMEYPGIRVTMNANVGRLITPLKIDISTGDVITPRAIEFNYDLLLEDRSISLWIEEWNQGKTFNMYILWVRSRWVRMAAMRPLCTSSQSTTRTRKTLNITLPAKPTVTAASMMTNCAE